MVRLPCPRTQHDECWTIKQQRTSREDFSTDKIPFLVVVCLFVTQAAPKKSTFKKERKDTIKRKTE